MKNKCDDMANISISSDQNNILYFMIQTRRDTLCILNVPITVQFTNSILFVSIAVFVAAMPIKQ